MTPPMRSDAHKRLLRENTFWTHEQQRRTLQPAERNLWAHVRAQLEEIELAHDEAARKARARG